MVCLSEAWAGEDRLKRRTATQHEIAWGEPEGAKKTNGYLECMKKDEDRCSVLPIMSASASEVSELMDGDLLNASIVYLTQFAKKSNALPI